MHIHASGGSCIKLSLMKNKAYVYKHFIPIETSRTQYLPFVDRGQKIDKTTLGIKTLLLNEGDKTFTIVRNPYMRFLATYNFLLNGGNGNDLSIKYRDILLEYDGFENTVKNIKMLKKQIAHFIDQYEFITSNDGLINVDSILKFENLEDDLKNYDNNISISKHKNFSENDVENIEYLTDYTKNLIYKAYKKDFDTFNYDM